MRPLLFLLILLMNTAPATAQPALRVTGAPVRLTEGDTFFMRPFWSPEGDRVAFTGANYRGLWVMDVADRRPVQLSDEAAAGFGASWSADGGALLARVARQEGPRRFNAVKVFDAATGESRQLTDYRAFMPGLPHWSAAGDQALLYHRGTLEALETGRPPIPGKADAPVYFLREDRIGTARTAGGVLTLLEPLPGRRVLNLAAAPDGSRLAFEVMGGGLYVVNADGTGLTALGDGNRPQWSPDGQWIVFMRTRDDGHRFTDADLFAVRAEGGPPVQLTDTPGRLEMDPAWSPDGRFIAFGAHDEGALYLLPVAE